MTTEEFVQFGRDADIWIYTSSDFDTVYANFASNLTDFKSIKSQQVFDTEGGGDGMWFEDRLAEPGKWIPLIQTKMNYICFWNVRSFSQNENGRRCSPGFLQRCRT